MSLLYRVKCPFCGKVEDLPDSGPCRKCRNPIQLPGDGIIHITPDNRVICLKAYTRPGYMTNTTYLEQSSLDQMPPL